MDEALLFQSKMKNLYDNMATELLITKSFEEIISTNEGRVNFICDLVDMAVWPPLDGEGRKETPLMAMVPYPLPYHNQQE